MQEKITFTVPFCEDDIQSFAESNFGRELTDTELNRISKYWWDNDDIFCEKMDLMSAAIKMATDENINWSSVDKEFINEQQNHDLNKTN